MSKELSIKSMVDGRAGLRTLEHESTTILADNRGTEDVSHPVVELVPENIPRNAEEIDARGDSVNRVSWFRLPGTGEHFVRVMTHEPNWQHFGLIVPQEMGKDAFDHPFPTAAAAGAGRLALASSFEATPQAA